MDRSVLRSLSVLVVVFVATLLVLGGIVALTRGTPRPGGEASASAGPSAVPSTPSPTASPTPSPTATPSPTPTPIPDAFLVGAGDIAGCDWDTDEATAALLDGLEGTIFTAGDNVYPEGRRRTFADCFDPTWGRHLERIRPAPGNHDWRNGSLDAYLDYFGAAAVNEDGDPWYAYDLGAWRIIVLDSDCDDVGGCDADSAQGRWLADELAASDTRCTMAIWHHPRYSSGFHGNDRDVQPFWEALYEAGADVVVTGHDHDYERFAPMDANGDEDRERGLRQFVVGTGGIDLRKFEDPKPNSELRLAVTHGVIEFTLKDGGYAWRWIPIDGDVTDAGTATCH